MYLKRFDDFNNGIEVFRKMQSGKMKLEEVKNLQNVFNSNLNEISRERYKSEEQKLTLANIKLLNESQELLIYLMIILQLYLHPNTKQFNKNEFQVC